MSSLLVLCHYVHCSLLQSVLCHYITLNPLLVLTHYVRCHLTHYVHCYLLQSVHCLSVPHNVPSLCSMTLCLLLSSKFCPLSVCKSLYHLLVLCHHAHWWLTNSPLYVSSSQWTFFWFCVVMSTAESYNLSTVCHYLTMIWLSILCYFDHRCLLQYVPYLSVIRNLPSVFLWHFGHCYLLQSVHSVYLAHYRLWFCVTMTNVFFYTLSNVCVMNATLATKFNVYFVKYCIF